MAGLLGRFAADFGETSEQDPSSTTGLPLQGRSPQRRAHQTKHKASARCQKIQARLHSSFQIFLKHYTGEKLQSERAPPAKAESGERGDVSAELASE